MSKDLKPKQRLGQVGSRKKKIIIWSVFLLLAAGGGYAAYNYGAKTVGSILIDRMKIAGS